MSPLLPLLGGVAILVGVICVATWLLWLRPGVRSEFHERFGQPMLVAAVIGLAFALVQAATQLELRQADRRAAARARQQDAARARQSQSQAARQQLLLEITTRRDLRGIDLHGEDLHGLYLRGKDFREADLSGANLRSAVLDDANLDRANLADADLRGARLVRTRIRAPTLAVIHEQTFARTRFQRAFLFQAKLNPVSNSGDANFDGATLVDVDLGDVGPISASFKGAVLIRVRGIGSFDGDLAGATIVNDPGGIDELCSADLHGAKLVGRFDSVDFTGADLRGAIVVSGTRFHEATLHKTDMRGLRWVRRLTVSIPNAPQALGPFSLLGPPLDRGIGGFGGRLPGRRGYALRVIGLPRGRPWEGARYDNTTRGADDLSRLGAVKVRSAKSAPWC